MQSSHFSPIYLCAHFGFYVKFLQMTASLQLPCPMFVFLVPFCEAVLGPVMQNKHTLESGFYIFKLYDDWQTDRVADWLTEWLTKRLIDCLTDRLTDWWTNRHTHWLNETMTDIQSPHYSNLLKHSNYLAVFACSKWKNQKCLKWRFVPTFVLEPSFAKPAACNLQLQE